jgi:hypothetical protein
MQKKAPLPASVVRQQFRVAARKRKLDEIKELLPSDDEFVNGTVDLATSKMPRIEYELTPDGKIFYDVANAVSTDELVNLLLISKCLKKNVPTRSTFIGYLKRISILRREITASPGFDFLKNTEKIINTVIEKYNSASTRAATFVSLTSICGRLQSFEEQYRIYSDFGNNLQKKIIEKSKENTLSANQEKSWLPWDKILDLAPAIEAMSISDQLIYGLYTQHPPRRIMDYFNLSIFIEKQSNGSLELIPTDSNYLIVDSANVPIGLSISIYKTSKSYGPYRFLLEKNSKLFYLFQTYIAHVPAHGDFLFNNQELQCVDETSFSRKIGNIFDSATLKVFGKKIRVTANILRHSFISNMLEKNLFKTFALRTQKAFEMGHSLKDQFLYVKYV